MKVLLSLLAVLCGLMVMTAPAMAQAAGPSIIINDGSETMSASATVFQNNNGTALAVPTITQEAQTTAGHVDFDGWYNLASGALTAGSSVTYNFNIYDPASEGGALSDTWQLIFTGENPANDGGNNMRVIAPFFSDSLAENGGITPLAGTVISITETGSPQWLTTTGSSNTTATIFGATFQFTSDVETVPEPASLLLLGFGLFGVGFVGRKIKK